MNIELGLGWLQIVWTLKSHLQRTKFCACNLLRETVTVYLLQCRQILMQHLGRFDCVIGHKGWQETNELSDDRRKLLVVQAMSLQRNAIQSWLNHTISDLDNTVVVCLRSVLELWNFLSVISPTIQKEKQMSKVKATLNLQSFIFTDVKEVLRNNKSITKC